MHGRSLCRVVLQLLPEAHPAARSGFSVPSFHLETGLRTSRLKPQSIAWLFMHTVTRSCLPALVPLNLLLKHGAPGKILLFRLNDRPVSLSSVRDGAGPVTEAGALQQCSMEKTWQGSFYTNPRAHSSTVLYGGFSMPSPMYRQLFLSCCLHQSHSPSEAL